MSFQKKVEALCQLHGQRKLARMAGLSEAEVSLLRRGKRKPRLETAAKIARAVGIPLDRLL